MNAWAKRGLKAAFFTGGMLVLGAGIASANECCPDRPTPPLAASVSVPVHICDNVVGGPGGPYTTPCVHETVSTDQVLAVVPQDLPLAGQSGDDHLRGNRGHLNLVVPVHVAGNAVAMGEDAVADGSSDFVYHRPDPVYTDGDAGAFAGNVLAGDAVVPLVATGNALGILGNAYSEANSTTDVSSGGDVYTNGDHGPFAGNVLAPAFALPFQASGNGAGLAGTGVATGRHSLTTTSGGDIGTTGQDNLLSGNVVPAALALPFQANSNGIAGAGEGYSLSDATTVTTASGDVVTNGDPAAGSGNIAAPAVSGPVQLAGNAVGALAQAGTAGSGTNTATSGGDYGTTGSDSLASGSIVNPAVALPVQGAANAIAAGSDTGSIHEDTTTSTAGGEHSTDGRSGVASGEVATVPVAGPVQLVGNAVAGAGTSTTDTTTESDTTAAAGSATNGDDSLAGGAVAATPVAMPVLGYGNGAAALGAATAEHTNEVTPTAGGDTYTMGDGSIAGGTMASPMAGGPVEVFGNAVAAGADTVAEGRNTADTTAGGFQGTRGSESLAGGNLAQAPVALPFQVMGNAAGGAGTADGSASNAKTTEVGGPPTTDDDAGLLASNVVNPALSGPVEVFGNAAGGAAEVVSNVDSTSDITAGGPATATGTGGVGSGNIAQGPLAFPVQVFGDVATVAADGESTTSNDTTSTAGGDLTSDGQDGLASGNLVTAGTAAATQVLGGAASGLGEADSATTNETESLSGGAATTSGAGGFVTGNAVQVPTLALPQPFGAAVAGAAVSESAAVSETDLISGGPVDTDGTDGAIAGNIVSVPAGAFAQAFAAAVSAVGAEADADGDNTVAGTASGVTTTAGNGGLLTGIDGQVPVGAIVQPHDLPVEVLAEATTTASNSTEMVLGEAGPFVNVPLSGEGIPSLSGTGDRSMDRSFDGFGGTSAFFDALDGLNGLGLPAVGSMPAIPALPGPASDRFVMPFPSSDLPGVDPLAGGGLPVVGSVAGDGVPDVGSVADGGLPGLGSVSNGGLPVVGSVSDGGLPDVGSVTSGGGVPVVGPMSAPIVDAVAGNGVGAGLPGMEGVRLPFVGRGFPVGTLPGTGGSALDGGLPGVDTVKVPGMNGALPGMHAVRLPGTGGGLPGTDVVQLPGLDGVSLPLLDGGLPVGDAGLPALDGGLPVLDGGLPNVDGGLPVGGDAGLPGLDGVSLPAAPGLPAVSRSDFAPNPTLPGTPAPASTPMPGELSGELPAFDSLGGEEMLRRLTDELAGLVDAPASLPTGGSFV